MNLKPTILSIFAGLLFILLTGFSVEKWQQIYLLQSRVEQLEIVHTILTFRELQQALVDAGYGIGDSGVDGYIGTDTLNGWDKAICDIEYEKSLSLMRGEK